MLRLPDITELTLFGVYSAGVPNEERIVLKTNVGINIGQFAVMVAWGTTDGGAIPLPNLSLWLGDQHLDANTWILIYTGQGTRQIGKFGDTNETYVTMHWGNQQTLFSGANLIPVLFYFNGIVLGHVNATIPAIRQ